MNRPFASIAAILLFLTPALARAQGLLIVDDPNEQVRLPRPIIIWPPHPHPMPHPVPPPPPMQLQDQGAGASQARLIDQVAQVQVSQTFVNTGSRPMEVAFVFPLPYDGAIDQMTLLIDGKEYPAKLLDAKEARRMYEEIVRKNRDPALLEWMGTGLFRTSVFPVPAGASRTVSLRYSQLCRKQEGLTDFLFPLSTAKYTSEAVEKVEHPRDDREPGGDQERLQPLARRRDQAARRAPRHGHLHAARTRCPASDFRLLYDVGKGKVSTRVLSYRPDKGQDGYFLLLASPEIKAADQKRPAKTVMLRDRPLGQHERQEDRAGQGGAEVRAEQPPPGRPVQHHRLRQPGRVVPARVAAVRRGDAQGGVGLRRGALRRRQHEHRRRAAHRPGPTCRTPTGPTT